MKPPSSWTAKRLSHLEQAAMAENRKKGRGVVVIPKSMKKKGVGNTAIFILAAEC